ncbi:MAG: Hsp20/alpha crystallin family protein [Planctomycetes bacterium]|nr:Hsp20/alpha crystallin family protein [Planctomycetota bacterium]
MKSLITWRRRNGEGIDLFRNGMREFFDRFFATPWEGPTEESLVSWTPRIDVSETDKELQVKADLPGVDPKDVEVTVRDGSLIFRGEKKEEREEKKKDYHCVERFEGSFYREIPLPTGADPEKITATSTKGVFTVTIPKTPQALPKKIAVKAQD